MIIRQDEGSPCKVYVLQIQPTTLYMCKTLAASTIMVDARLTDAKSTFSAFSHILDARILRALADMGFARPTLVQVKAIPIALENRDILARARTGSGKTAAYCIPVLHKILSAKMVSPMCVCPRLGVNEDQLTARPCQSWTLCIEPPEL